MNFNSWKKEILLTSQRRNNEEEENFLKLLDYPFKWDQKSTAKVLMQTFSNRPDYGTQEKVISKLSELEPSIYIDALLEELPRLTKEADQWVESLLGLEIIERANLVRTSLERMPPEIKHIFYNVISQENFKGLFPEARDFLL